MESNLSFLSTRAVAAPATESSAPAGNPSAPASLTADGRDFSEVLNGQTLKAQRQHLAALDTAKQGLQVVPLGSHLNIITSDAPLPDMDSLAQFARMQGLDEGAVQALFGTPSASAAAALGGVTLTQPGPQDLSSALASTATPASSLGLETSMPVAVLAPLPVSTPALTPSNAAVAIAPALPPGVSIATVADAALADLSGAAPDKETANTDAPDTALSSTLAAPETTQLLAASLAPVAVPTAAVLPATPPTSLAIPAALAVKEISVSLGAMPSALGTVAAAPLTDAMPAALTLASAAVQTSLMPLSAQAWMGSAPVAPLGSDAAAAPLAPQDALRLTLAMPAPEITKRLAQMSGTGKEATWAALLASGPVAKEQPGAIQTVALELPAGLDLEALIADHSPTPSDLSTQAGAGASMPGLAAASAGSGSNADTAQAQADQRAQQFQQLADKMGQAAAQRLIAQIERGQWKMQMRMQPAALGSISVQLDMHAGGLDALFSTDNAATRELMAQGSNKLRDTLSQAGMTVASVTVNAEQGRQSGGNPTPGKGRSAASGTRSVSGPASAAPATPQGGASLAADGLNVLA